MHELPRALAEKRVPVLPIGTAAATTEGLCRHLFRFLCCPARDGYWRFVTAAKAAKAEQLNGACRVTHLLTHGPQEQRRLPVRSASSTCSSAAMPGLQAWMLGMRPVWPQNGSGRRPLGTDGPVIRGGVRSTWNVRLKAESLCSTVRPYSHSALTVHRNQNGFG